MSELDQYASHSNPDRITEKTEYISCKDYSQAYVCVCVWNPQNMVTHTFNSSVRDGGDNRIKSSKSSSVFIITQEVQHKILSQQNKNKKNL